MRVAFIILSGLLFLSPPGLKAAELIMVEEQGCIWCQTWDEEIGPIYPKTTEGKFARLRKIDLHDEYPPNLSFTSPPVFTPTFILVADGRELDRIEGYPGEDFFWGLLGLMLTEHTSYCGGSNEC